MQTKITIHCLPRNGGPFNCLPAREVQLDPKEVLCNDIVLPGERQPQRLYVIGNEYGALGAVWAEHEQDALDALCDEGLSAGLMVDEGDVGIDEEGIERLGNAGEPHNLDNAWIQMARLTATEDFPLLLKFAEARGAGVANLDKL